MLDGFDEGVDGLVLLLIEEQVQALEIGLGRCAVFTLPGFDAGSRRDATQPRRNASGRTSSSHLQFEIHAPILPRLLRGLAWPQAYQAEGQLGGQGHRARTRGLPTPKCD